MAFRDRFFTPRTARAIMSWRILLGAAAGVAAAVVGLAVPGAVVVGAAVYAGSVLLAMPRAAGTAPRIDPFAISEPWRHFVTGAQRSRRHLAATVRNTPPGPLRDRLRDIAARLDEALTESWEIARRGDEIDGVIASLDPTRLRARLATLRQQAADEPTENLAAAVASLESQLASADRLRVLSAATADRLRLSQARLDELVSRAAEVSVGAGDTKVFEHDVDDLVVELEALHLAVRELPQ